MKNFLFLTFLLYLVKVHSQNQIGGTITGGAEEDLFGYEMELNADGSVLAIGAPENDDLDSNAGHVKVFAQVGGVWTQLGQTLTGDTVDAQFGTSIALNAEGNTVVVGAPRHYSSVFWTGKVEVFDWNGVSWVQRGQAIEGVNQFDNLGISVDVNKSGNTIVLGAYKSGGVNNQDKGNASVYDWNGMAWILRGSKLLGDTSYSNFGNAVSIDSSGNRIAISETNYSASPYYGQGRVVVYDWNGTNWIKAGADILGDTTRMLLGTDVELSANGNTLAIGTPNYAVHGIRKGIVKVYYWNGGSWNQKGNSLVGIKSQSAWGYRVDMNNNGNILLSGSSANGVNLFDPGYAQAYEYVNGNWLTKGNEIIGLDSTDQFGWSVALDSSGNIAVVGAPRSDDSFVDAGHVRVFDLSGTVGFQEKKEQSVATLSPNPFTTDFVISFKNVESGTMRLFDTSGKVVQIQTFNKNRQVRVECHGTPGQYFLELEFDKKIRETYKIIKL